MLPEGGGSAGVGMPHMLASSSMKLGLSLQRRKMVPMLQGSEGTSGLVHSGQQAPRQSVEDATWLVAKSGALGLAHGQPAACSFLLWPQMGMPCAPHPQPSLAEAVLLDEWAICFLCWS